MDLIHTALPVPVIDRLPQIQVIPTGTEGGLGVHIVAGNGHRSRAAAGFFCIIGTVGVSGIGLVRLKQMRGGGGLKNTVFIDHIADPDGRE